MKPDAEEFRNLLAQLSRKPGLGRPKQIWLKYSFHFTDIRNAAKILNDGKIISRARLEDAELEFVDIASPDVIQGTDGNVKSFVRLYFRPRTPTQFHMEGIRPKSELWKNCHCPVPIFFLFDSFSILTRDEAQFSEKNLALFAQSNSLVSTAAELREFNWDEIFHVGSFSQDSRASIISHRNAEIVIPDELDLSALRFIYCRTPAEKETLLHLLPTAIRREWSPRIVVATSADLFIRDRVFIDKVDLESSGLNIYFSPEPRTAGPFDLKVIRRAHSTAIHSESDFYATGKFPIRFRQNELAYEVEVYLDDNLAYAGSFASEDDIPF